MLKRVNWRRLIFVLVLAEFIAIVLCKHYFKFSIPIEPKYIPGSTSAIIPSLVFPEEIFDFANQKISMYQNLVPGNFTFTSKYYDLCFDNKIQLLVNGKPTTNNLGLEDMGYGVLRLGIKYSDGNYIPLTFKRGIFRCYSIDMLKAYNGIDIGQLITHIVSLNPDEIYELDLSQSRLYIWPGFLNLEILALVIFLALSTLLIGGRELKHFYTIQ